jgi:gliding motility-associated-like protein
MLPAKEIIEQIEIRMKSQMKSVITGIFVLFAFGLCNTVNAQQCTFDLNTEVIQHGICVSSGIIKVTLSGDEVDLSSVYITLTMGSINESSSKNGHQFETLPAGTYTITAQAICKNTLNPVTRSTTATIVSYYDGLFASSGSNKRSSLNCINSGMISINISDGRPPFKVEITSKPDAYTGETVFTYSSVGYMEFDGLAPGDYVFTVSDDCPSSTRPITATVDKIANDFPSNPFDDFNPSSCNQAYVYENSYESNQYWLSNRDYYEIAFTFDDTKDWIPAAYYNYDPKYIDLPKSYKELYDEGAKMKVYLRLKNTECEQLVDEIQFPELPKPEIWAYEEKTCDSYKLNFYLNEYALCSPFKWEIIDDDTGVSVANAENISSFNTQSAENLVYNKRYTLKVTDKNGTEATRPFSYEKNNSDAWIGTDRYIYTYDLHYEAYNICLPYKWEVYDADGNLVTSRENVDGYSDVITGLEYGKEYTVKIFDESGNEILFTHTEPAPDRYIHWDFVGGGGDGEGAWDCENYKITTQPININLPYTWTLMDENRNVLLTGQCDEYNNVLPGLQYNVAYIIEITDGIETVELQINSDAVSSPAPYFSIFGDGDYQCNDYAFEFRAENIFCFPYKWEISDSDGNIVEKGDEIKEIQSHTVRLKYDMQYTVKVTDSKDREITNGWYRADNDLRPYMYSWWYSDQQCYDYGYAFDVNVTCFPYKWEIYDSDNVPVSSQEGLTELNTQNARLEYNKDYTIKITDGKGRESSYPQRLNRESVSFNFDVNSFMSSCVSNSHSGYIRLYGQMEIGTRIRFVSGPTTPVHEDVVLEEYIDNFYPFSEDYHYREDIPIAAGEYIFEITDKCGDIHRLTRPHDRNVKAEGFSYTLDETTDVCNGITRLYPKGRIPGYSYSTHFVMMDSPVPEIIGNTVYENDYFQLSKTGRYVIGIKASSESCVIDTLIVDHVQKSLTLDGRSSYVCDEGSIGHIRVQAKYGKPPYTYTLYNEDSTPVTDVAPNNTGEFEYGAFGEKYFVIVQDACNSSFQIDVQINTLDPSTLISGKSNICKGEAIEMYSLLLGATVYEWSGPLGFSANTRNISIPDATADHSGEYVLRVKPAGCDLFFSGKITVNVHDTPTPEIQGIVELCQAEDDTRLEAKPLSSDYSVQWYDENDELLTEAPLINLRELGNYVFYVTQTEDMYGCVSEKKKIEVKVNPLPEKNAAASGFSCPDANPKITVTDIVVGYVYSVYSDAEATDLITTFIGTEETMTVDLPIIATQDATFYLQTATSAGCTLSPSTVEFLIDVDELEISPSTLPVYIHDVPYSVQLSSNAEEGVFSYTGNLVTGITLTSGGLISGTVPNSAGFEESIFTVTVTNKNECTISKEYTLRSCEPAPEILVVELSYCQNAQAVALQASSPNGFPLQWYDAAMNKLTEAPVPNTTVVGEQIFYVAQVNESLQCEGTKAEIKVVITPLPQPDFEAFSDGICDGDSPAISLTNLQNNYTYDIYADIQKTEKLASVTDRESDDVSLSVVPEASTSYYIFVTDNLSCVSNDFVEVEIDVTKLEISPEQLPVYAHEIPYSVQLESNAEEGVFTHVGNLVTGISMNSGGLISGTVPESAGREESTFTVTVTDIKGCQTVKEYLLRTCEPTPDVPLTAVAYCQGVETSPIQASSPNGNIIQWYDSNMNTLDAAPVPSTAISGEQIFYVSQINETLQCEGPKAQVTVLVNAAPAIDFNVSADSVCVNSSPVIKLENIRENYIYSIYPDNTFSEILASLTGVNSETVGTVVLDNTIEDDTVYWLTVTDDIGCTSIDWAEIPVKVIKLYIEPEKLMQYQKNTEYEQKLFTNAQSPVFTVVNGTLPEGLTLTSSGTLSGNVPSNEHSTRNVFTVEVLDSHGCRVLQEYTLYGNVFVPKIFTPNGDGVNDIFMQDYKVVIFDRLGIEMFRGDDGWDGTYKGKPVAADIYFYKLEYVDGNGIVNILTGYVGVQY